MTPKPLSVEAVWQDQAEFNRLFRPTDPTTFAEKSALTREMVLHLIAQATQLLECTDWRTHRNRKVMQNQAQIGSQLTDIHKYFITLCQTWGYTFEDMIELYWKKSIVCRQRYAEEWVRSIKRPTVILDLDGVLCDYVTGFGGWLANNALLTPTQAQTLDGIIARRSWLNADTLGMDPGEYQEVKHRFRTSGVKSLLPTMPGAKAFVDWCRSMGWQILVLTSRPVDAYPNLYSDTLEWLDRNEMPVDFVWWGADKGEKVITSEVVPYIEFVVDDDLRYAQQYASLGMRTYWLQLNTLGHGPCIDIPGLYVTSTLETIVEAEHVRRSGSPTAR